MSVSDAEVTELVSSLKQLLVSFSPYIQKAGSSDQAEEAILHMEENDENFHRYEFVKKLRHQIDSTLGNLIDEEIEKHSMGPNDSSAGQETVVSKITDRILQSHEFQALTQTLKVNITAACDHLIRNFDTEFATEGSTKSTLGRRQRRQNDVIFSDEESSLGDSSLNPSDVMFMNSDHFQKIAEKLDKKKPLETRQEALTKLLQVTPLDIQNSDLWAPITRGLHDALSDPDETLWNKSLKFVARGLSANNSSTRNLYTTLVEFLSMQFNSVNKSNIPRLQAGLDSQKPEIIRLLKGFRLMNDFQQQIPQYWVRHPEKFVDDVLEATLTLLSTYTRTASGTAALVSPAHFLALLDPRATWFIRWMHGHYSRAPLLKNLERHKSVVEVAVRSCLDFIMSKKLSSTQTSYNKSAEQRAVYSGDELEFIHFVQSISILGRLLCYEQGRKLFPIKVKDRDEPVSVTRFIVYLIQLLTDLSCKEAVPQRGPAAEFEPCRLVADTLKRLCSSEAICQKCVCRDDVTDALLDPVSYWLDGTGESGMTSPSDTSMLHIADILSHMASNGCGRHHLLYGESGNRFTKSKSSPVHVICEFARKAVSGTLGSEYSRHPSLAVVGNLVFVCRQLYSTCDGLQVTYPYDLHTSIAAAWKVANHEADRAATPTPSVDGQDPWGSTANIVLWEDTLKDNLLSYSGTPKGLLLLQQTGAMNDCVTYLFYRYARKLQVSKYEKFGYGYMISEVAAVSSGVVAILQTDFIPTLIRSVWSSLEVVGEPLVHVPRPWPIIPIDKHIRKPFASLVTLLSSFSAVYEVLAKVQLPTKDTYTFRDVPESVAGLLDRLVMVDSEAKIHSLFNFEQSHVFGLRLMSVLISCLDSFLLLQTQYNFQETLLQAQRENALENSSQIILDMLSIERNYLLVKTYTIGGPSERILPSRTPNPKMPNALDHQLFSSYPVPKEYIPNIATKSTGKFDSDLSKFLSSTKKVENGSQWLERCKKNFCSLLTSKPEHAKGAVLQDLLEQMSCVLTTIPEEAIFPLLEYTGTDSTLKNVKLTAAQKLGVEMAIRYGSHLKLVANNDDTTNKLTGLLKKANLFLKQQQRACPNAPQRSLQSTTTGYDWFLSTVFLLMQGDEDRTWRFLHRFSALAASAYLWNDRLHCSVHLKQPLMLSGIPVLFSNTCHHIEHILQAEVTHVYMAFKMSGYSPAQICQHWLRQCFWNYLDWRELCHYLCVCVVLGIDYQVYTCVAILKYKQTQIRDNMQEKNLLVYLKEEPITGFKVGQHLEYMQQLQNRYRKTVLADMLNISRP